MRTRAERRHEDWAKAIRKKRISDHYSGGGSTWYNNLHQYSKGKIHCSCPLCRCKTRDKESCGPAENWPMSDIRQFSRMKQNEAEYFEEIGDDQE